MIPSAGNAASHDMADGATRDGDRERADLRAGGIGGNAADERRVAGGGIDRVHPGRLRAHPLVVDRGEVQDARGRIDVGAFGELGIEAERADRDRRYAAFSVSIRELP